MAKPRVARRIRALRFSQAFTLNALRTLWLLVVLWNEWGTFFWSLMGCRWPKPTGVVGSTNILLVSDTQVRVSSSGRSLSMAKFKEFIYSSYLKKSWYATKYLEPDVILFLGDMLANGKSARNEAQYNLFVERFKSIFLFNPSTPVYFIPGNNDVGMDLVAHTSKSIRVYYERAFGPMNQIFTIQNHTFLALDAPGLVDEDHQRFAQSESSNHWTPIPGGTVEAVRQAGAEHYHPLILLSHIPLDRPDTASCGPLRETGAIHRGAGRGYQNTLGKQTTAFLVETLQPSIVFSGDNRDYCEHIHHKTSPEAAEQSGIPEITIKSFSPFHRIRRPGFQLLTVTNPVNLPPQSPSLQHRLCQLPDPRTSYLHWFTLTLIILFVLKFVQRSRRRNLRLNKPQSLSLPLSSSFSDFSPSSSTSPLFRPSEIDEDDEPGVFSPIWSPYTPPGSTPASPYVHTLGYFPSRVRTSVAMASPTFRATSTSSLYPEASTQLDLTRSPTVGSALGLDPVQGQDVEWASIDEDDYAPRADAFEFPPSPTTIHTRLEMALHSAAQESHRRSLSAHFMSAPTTHSRNPSMSYPWSSQTRSEPTDTLLWSCSWVFRFRGSVRRIRIGVPRLSTFREAWKDVHEVFPDGVSGVEICGLRRRARNNGNRGIVFGVLLDWVGVVWPAIIVWVVINGWLI